MSIVVGAAPGQDNRAAVELGIVLARSYSQRLTVVVVNSAAWPPSRIKIDVDYQAFIRKAAEATLDEARAIVPEDIDADYRVHGAGSSRRGLLEVCESTGAFRLVVGSAEEGEKGRITLGSVSSGLLHSAPLPVAIAPEGYRAEAGATFSRITAAYSGSSTSADLILGAAVVSVEMKTPFRIASFAPRSRRLAAASIGRNVEAHLIEEWKSTVQTDTRVILGEIAGMGFDTTDVEVDVGTGSSWREALESVGWKEPEVMMLGSSGLGALKRVALGSHAARILANSPVPVVVVPRRAKSDYTTKAFSLIGK